MPLEPGSTLGPYEVVSPLGAGGMGEVYRARDPKLDRDVALKVLPEAFTADADRLTRFEREAKVLASLNHPHIGHIYGLEEADGQKALVLELVEGPTLADRIAQGPIPLDEALPIAKQIAEALEAAHEQGIIHRDLKPANVKVKPDGTVKVLDFGLAKAMESEGADADDSQSPTLSARATQAGVILGTAAYMSPEQARGKPVDRRTDIWAFGCVLFEMLTAQRVFRGDDVTDTLASVLRNDPDWGALPHRTTPPAVRRLLERCLDREPRGRLQHMGDARLELAAAAKEPTDSEELAPVMTPRRRLLPWMVAILGLAAAVGALLLPRGDGGPPPRPMMRTSIVLPPEAPLAPSTSFFLSVGSPALALAPDGSALVYVALVDESRQLYHRDMRTGETRAMPTTTDAQGPFFSPDGRWVGFFAEGKLKKIPVEGGESQVLTDAIWGHGGDWSTDGFIYFCPTELRAIHRVPAAGGAAEPVVTKAPDVYMQVWPARVPGTDSLLLTRVHGRSQSVAVASLGDEAPPTPIVELGAWGWYASTGHLLFTWEGRLLASPFDPAVMRPSDAPTVLLEGVRTEERGAAQVAWSADGTLVYAPGSDVAAGRFVWVDRSGKRAPLDLPAARYGAFAVSPDGSTLAYTGPENRLWLYDLERGGAPRLLTPEGHEGSRRRWGVPAWAADGEALFAGAVTEEGQAIVRIPIDGPSRAQVDIVPPRPQAGLGDATAEGYVYSVPGRIVLLPHGEGGNPEPSRARTIVELPETVLMFPALSPDGRWLAYMSDESGTWEIYVASFPDASFKRTVSFAGGEEPRWSPDGGEIIYRFGPRWYSVSFDGEPNPVLGRPRLLLDGPFINVPGYSWDISPDGDRLLVIENPDAGAELRELVVVHNFLDELQRRVPGAER